MGWGGFAYVSGGGGGGDQTKIKYFNKNRRGERRGGRQTTDRTDRQTDRQRERVIKAVLKKEGPLENKMADESEQLARKTKSTKGRKAIRTCRVRRQNEKSV